MRTQGAYTQFLKGVDDIEFIIMSQSPLVGFVVKESSNDECGSEVITFQEKKWVNEVTEVSASSKINKCEENDETKGNEGLINFESDNIVKSENLRKPYTVKIEIVDSSLEEIIDVCHAGCC